MPPQKLGDFSRVKKIQTDFTTTKIKNLMKNGRLNTDVSTKVGTKTAENPDNYISNPSYTYDDGKWAGG